MANQLEGGRLRLLSSLIVIVLMSSVAFGSQVIDLSEIGVGARVLGMGRASLAVGNDGLGLFTNPAGLAFEGLRVMSMGGNLMAEIPYTVLGGSYPVLNGVVGVGYIGVGVSGIMESRLNGITPEVTGVQGSYANSTFAISYAREINRDFSIFKNNKFGVTFKLISQGFSGSASFEGGGGSGFDIDLGLASEIDKDTKAGFVIKNLIPGNNVKGDELGMVIGCGLARVFSQYNLLGAVDAEVNRGLLFHIGAEWNPVKMLKLRCGLDQKPSAGGVSTDIGFGIGVLFRGFTFDYAYRTFAELPEGASHYISIGYIGEEKVTESPSPTTPKVEIPQVVPEVTPVPQLRLEPQEKLSVKAKQAPKTKPKIIKDKKNKLKGKQVPIKPRGKKK